MDQNTSVTKDQYLFNSKASTIEFIRVDYLETDYYRK